VNIDNWKPFFKYGDDGELCLAQQTYEPLISPDRTVFCANYDWQNKYQRLYETRDLYNEEVCEWFFQNEVNHLLKFKHKQYAPNILDIDYKNKKIFFEWNGYTFNEMLHRGEHVEWREPLKNIMLDLVHEGIYKLTMYPHCHFLDKSGTMKTIDWYGCISSSNPLIETKYMDAIVHETARFRLNETVRTETHYNLEVMYQQSMRNHVKWAGETLEYIYGEIRWNN
jgi:hypothetical protein